MCYKNSPWAHIHNVLRYQQVCQMYNNHWPLFCHSILELFPISSSWHVKTLYHLTSKTVHDFHLWLAPGLLIILWLRSNRSDYPKPIGTILAAIAPGVLAYFLTKSQIISKFALPSALLHFSMGWLLYFISQRQMDKEFPKKDISVNALWLLIGLCDSLGSLVPGLSRMTASFLPGLFFKLDFRRTLIISFSLNLCLQCVKIGVDTYRNQLALPTILQLFLAIIGLVIGWAIAEKYKWNFLKYIGMYRIALGTLLFLLPYMY
ncbi:MAG: hypothetical protein FJ161_00565 [Gammaproteobacteria bacterium]|nr:hypothetical protein [Gammaproteobacteria bacterium]